MAVSDAPDRQGFSRLFASAFAQSKNAMVLVDARRRLVDANGAYIVLLGYERRAIIGRPIYRHIAGGPLLSPSVWKGALKAGRFSGEGELLCADGSHAAVQYAATTEIVTGHRLTLVVALSTSRWGSSFRRTIPPRGEPAELSKREREIVGLVALGHTGPEIADQLQIAHHTVRTHVRNAMAKTDARSRAHLVAKSLAEGLCWTDGVTGAQGPDSTTTSAIQASARSPAVPEVEHGAGPELVFDDHPDLSAMRGEPQR
jgi:PAS domain S-box-containing protein